MNLSNKLLSRLQKLQPETPDKELLLCSDTAVLHSLDPDCVLSQLRFCLDNKIEDNCYAVLKDILCDYYGSYEVDILLRRYKQCQLIK